MKRRADGGEERLDDEERGDSSEEHGDIRGDEKNVAFLLFLYLLQGVPLGLCAAIPMILQNRGVSYKQQAEFSFVQWPFSLKLLWAPLVDAIFVPRFGRRKTWLVPTQYLMGIFMLYLSGHVEHWLNDDREGHGVGPLTLLFFTLNVLAATQDIVVDGWALTMLKRKNVGYASTCNSVGQTAGYFLGYVLFMALESPEFCNGYLRSVPSDAGIVTLPGFLYAWGWIFVTVTTLIALMKHEDAEADRRSDDIIGHARQAYDSLWSIVKLPTVAVTATILLTAKIGFSACDAVTGLKLVEAGVPKEKLALMAVPLVPLQIVLPLAVSRYTAGDRPLDIYLKAVPYRLVLGLSAALLVWVTPSMIYRDGGLPVHYAVILIALYVFHQIAASSMFVASMAFFAKVSDPALGGTYMTFLNTLCNLGGNWPATAALWFVDALTLRSCSTDPLNDCGDTLARETCASNENGQCEIRLDGYYTESLLCFVVGFLWLAWARKKIDYLQSRPRSAWRVVQPRKAQPNVKIR